MNGESYVQSLLLSLYTVQEGLRCPLAKLLYREKHLIYDDGSPYLCVLTWYYHLWVEEVHEMGGIQNGEKLVQDVETVTVMELTDFHFDSREPL